MEGYKYDLHSPTNPEMDLTSWPEFVHYVYLRDALHGLQWATALGDLYGKFVLLLEVVFLKAQRQDPENKIFITISEIFLIL